MSQALITGGAGFIGLHLARRLLREGWTVHLLDDFSRGRRDPDLDALIGGERVQVLQGNLLDPAFVSRLGNDYTEIFHFAAIVGVGNVIEQPYRVLESNVQLTAHAIELARRQRALRRFIFASTSEVYAGTLESYDLPIPTPESVPLALPPLTRPRSSYMLSKIYGEALCLHSGLPVTIVRPHNVYGPRMGHAHVIPQLLERAAAAPHDGELEVYSVDHTRTFCFVEDAVDLILNLAAAPSAAGQSVNVGAQEPEISIGQLAEIILAAIGKRLKIVPRPATQGSPQRRAPDMSLCYTLTGRRSQISLEDGVRRTRDWYRDQLPHRQ